MWGNKDQKTPNTDKLYAVVVTATQISSNIFKTQIFLISKGAVKGQKNFGVLNINVVILYLCVCL